MSVPAAEATAEAVRSVGVTRASARVEAYVIPLGAMLRAVVVDGQSLADVATATARTMLGAPPDVAAPDPVVACYIDGSFDSMLHFAAKYADLREMLLANANSGGENVHRGLVLGALAGAAAGVAAIPDDLKQGLLHAEAIGAEIDAFVAARVGADPQCGA